MGNSLSSAEDGETRCDHALYEEEYEAERLGRLEAAALLRRQRLVQRPRGHQLAQAYAVRSSVQRAPLPVAPRLPEYCYRHGSRGGCVDANCRRLHICHLFLADICKFGDACRNGHSLTTVHNQVVCSRYGLDTRRESAAVQKLRAAFQESGRMPDENYHQYLEVCFKAGSENSCDGHFCNRLHICRRFLAGNCTRPVCRFGHDLHTTHNNSVLSRHKVTKLRDAAILSLLREKYPARQEQGGGGSVAGGGPRQRREQQRGAAGGGDQIKARGSGGQASGGGQMKGIAEELQCPVCLDMLQRATTLGCGHTFCEACLQEVRENDPKCPMCRQRITSSIRSVTLDNIISSLAAHR
ncbi:protein mono-ADP-ribosyltransferase PARP12-like [Pollicipes pollicipes]|uniref:protein mono-ADP-ribosyltransferase PARP12-like n=1 Tax=Pollicipes pollicipes TaxID=41117 RepID=UPI0018852222|nr:protein mono-ADP-ribosyltransferase PARP12-like [Pollicipes pollicipes]